MTVERGDEAAAAAADGLRAIAEGCADPVDGRLVKLLGDGVLLRFDDAASAIRATLDLVDRVASTRDLPRPTPGSPPAGSSSATATSSARP